MPIPLRLPTRTRTPRALTLGFSVGLLGILAMLFPPLHEISENADLSWLFNVRGPRPPPAEVVIVSIDKESAREMNLPNEPHKWPRSLHAQLVDRLHAAGARVIGFDVMFKEMQRPDTDAAFEKAIRRAGNVILVDALDVQPLHGDRLAIEQVIRPLSRFADAAHATAIFPLPKFPKRVNQFWLFKAGAGDAPTLPLVMLQTYWRAKPEGTHAQRLQEIESGPHSRYLNYYGPARTIATVPYFRALRDDPAVFKDKAVFVGLSEPGQTVQMDTFHTVYSQTDGVDLSGVEIGATAFGNLLDESWVRPLSYSASFTLMLVWGVFLMLLCLVLPTGIAWAGALAACAVYFGAGYWLFAATHFWMPLFIPLVVQAPFAVFGATLLCYWQENREKRKVRDALGHYLPSGVVDEMADDIARRRETQHLVYGVCLATDAEHYTALSERMSPQVLGKYMNQYYAAVFAPVRRRRGFVSDVVGDSMLALWASLDMPDVQKRKAACQAALEIVQAVDEFNRSAPLPLPTRIGVHTGEMLLGNVGALDHYEYRAVGDVVNTSSRLQGLNKIFGTRVLVSSATLEGVDGLLACPLGDFMLTGKSSPVGVCELLSETTQGDAQAQQRCMHFSVALKRFRERDFVTAEQQFMALVENFPNDGAAKFFAAWCREYQLHAPPAGWNGAVSVNIK